jgi:hypothetical protein
VSAPVVASIANALTAPAPLSTFSKSEISLTAYRKRPFGWNARNDGFTAAAGSPAGVSCPLARSSVKR